MVLFPKSMQEFFLFSRQQRSQNVESEIVHQVHQTKDAIVQEDQKQRELKEVIRNLDKNQQMFANIFKR